MIGEMGQLHMTEDEVAGDFAAVILKIRNGAEVVVERGEQPLALIGPPEFRGRPLDECIALLKARDSHPIPDEDHAKSGSPI